VALVTAYTRKTQETLLHTNLLFQKWVLLIKESHINIL